MATVVKNRALSLATRGMLGGSVLALATHGLLQVPVTEAPPVEVPPVAVGGGSVSTFVDYFDDFPVVPKRVNYRFVSGLKLLVDPESRAWLTVCPPLRGHFTSRFWTLRLAAASEARFFDGVEADDEEAIILAAARYFFDDDDGGFYL